MFSFSTLIVEPRFGDAIAKAAGADIPDPQDPDIPWYDIACDAKVPPLRFTFGTQTFEIPSEELVKPAGYDGSDATKCRLDIKRYDIEDQVRIDPFFFSIGASFARRYCEVLDFDNNRIGIADNRINSS